MPHDRRPYHDAAHPVHITLRVTGRAGSLRRSLVAKAILARMRVVANAERFTTRRLTFQVNHFTIQKDHPELTGSSQHESVYHERALATPREVRIAIAYVLTNIAKHGTSWFDRDTQPVDGLDPCSSAWWFDGWRTPPPATTVPPPVAPPRTWLLAHGWRQHGLLGRHESPSH